MIGSMVGSMVGSVFFGGGTVLSVLLEGGTKRLNFSVGSLLKMSGLLFVELPKCVRAAIY